MAKDIAPYWKIPLILNKLVSSLSFEFYVNSYNGNLTPPPPPPPPPPNTHTNPQTQRQWIVASINWKSSDEIPAPSVRCCNGPYKLVNHSLFEWTLFAVIIVNIVCTIVELSISSDSVGQLVLEYLNYVFVTTYIVEAILKVRLWCTSTYGFSSIKLHDQYSPSHFPTLPRSIHLPPSAACRAASVLLLQQVEHL